MALQGTLDTFSLPDVLRLLANTAKTGRLRIDGDRGYGSVWLEGGSVVAADAERMRGVAPADELLFELMRFGSGSFSFDVDETPADAGPPRDVEQLLGSAASLLDEWHELERVVPSLNHRVTLASDLPRDHVTIDAGRWQTVVTIASGRTVAELGDSLGLSELGVSRAVHDLVELGVASVDSVAPPPAPSRAASPRSAASSRRATPASSLGPTVPDETSPPPLPAAPVESQRAGWLLPEEVTEPLPREVPVPAPTADNGQTRRRRVDSGRPTPPAPDLSPAGGSGSSTSGGRRRSSLPNGQTRKPSAGASGEVHDEPRPAGRRSRRGPRTCPVPPAPVTDPTFSAVDGVALDSPPLPADTGSGRRTVSSPARRSERHWDDNASAPTTGPAPVIGAPNAAGPALSMRPTGDSEVAPHVSAMTAEARAAVQATVGNDGGSAGPASGVSNADDGVQRGTLIDFLSSVRP